MATHPRPDSPELHPESNPVGDGLRARGQVVLVLQGGGALGAYQVGVFQGLHEAGIEPDWLIGTSIGAINAALIAGASPADRMARLQEFWDRVASEPILGALGLPSLASPALTYFQTVLNGISGFFEPNPLATMGLCLPVGSDRAALYSVDPLRRTLTQEIDFGLVNAGHPRLTVGAVNVRSGEMCYFDSRDMRLGVEHILASGALPPAFPAVYIDGEPYWYGGIYSNTPIEVVFDDRPRRNSVIFAVNLWQPHGTDPGSIMEVIGRQKDIQYSSRVKSHLARQEQIHQLRAIIRQLEGVLPPDLAQDPKVREMLAYGCGTTMHLIGLLAPRLPGEDQNKDVDFSRDGIRARWQAGYDDIRRELDEKPWETGAGPLQGVVVHETRRHDPTNDRG